MNRFDPLLVVEDASATACEAAEQLTSLIETHQALVAVVGLGYAGMPLAEAFLHAGIRVLGYDIDLGKVEQIRATKGCEEIGNLDLVNLSQLDGTFVCTSDPQQLAAADVIMLCVPATLHTDGSSRPDLTHIRSALRNICGTLRPGQLVVLNSPAYPGTTRDVVLKAFLDGRPELRPGFDYFVAYSPDREDPGSGRPIVSAPRVIGGVDPLSRGLAALIYASAGYLVHLAPTCEVAEASKLLESCYRTVNVALVNEIKAALDKLNINIWDVIEAAKTKPYGFAPFYPGPGAGGRGLPIDPAFLTWMSRQHDFYMPLTETSLDVNASRPYRVVRLVADQLNSHGKSVSGSHILVIGVAYKTNVADCRDSPAIKIIDRLDEMGAKLAYHDPFVPDLAAAVPHVNRWSMRPLRSTELTAELLRQQDCVVIVTDHRQIDYDLIAREVPADAIVDTRNAMARSVVSLRSKLR